MLVYYRDTSSEVRPRTGLTSSQRSHLYLYDVITSAQVFFLILNYKIKHMCKI